MTTPLQFETFGRRYQRRRPWAVRNVSFGLPLGSITALVGPNGAGKSTLLRACVGFERPDEGRVVVAGSDPQKDRMAAVEAVAYVAQASALYGGLTIADHMVMAAAARPSFDRHYAKTRVHSAGLTIDRRVGQLSGGEQAQVALALALGIRAQVLILDEPLASLDPLARRDFLTVLVDDVRTRGRTAVLSSHIITDVEQACDRLVVLAHGRLVANTSVSAAKAEFRTVAESEAKDHRRVGTFTGPSGERLTLISADVGGRSASLEEIVLGHLAAARESRGAGA